MASTGELSSRWYHPLWNVWSKLRKRRGARLSKLDPGVQKNSPCDDFSASRHSSKDHTTWINNRTEYTIALREKNRYVWGDDELVIVPNWSEKYELKNTRTFFQLGVETRSVVGKVKEKTFITVDGDELVDNSEITFTMTSDGKLCKHRVQRRSSGRVSRD